MSTASPPSCRRPSWFAHGDACAPLAEGKPVTAEPSADVFRGCSVPPEATIGCWCSVADGWGSSHIRRMTWKYFGLSALLIASTACGSSSSSSSDGDESFKYGRDEVRSAIEGTWEGSTTNADGSAGSPVTMTLTYAPSDAQTLCNTRVLSNADPLQGIVGLRCSSESEMNVTGTITPPSSGDEATPVSREIAIRGFFIVAGLNFDGDGALTATADGRSLDAVLSNAVLKGSLKEPGGGIAFNFSLQRK
jgi:hypothetical protein